MVRRWGWRERKKEGEKVKKGLNVCFVFKRPGPAYLGRYPDT